MSPISKCLYYFLYYLNKEIQIRIRQDSNMNPILLKYILSITVTNTVCPTNSSVICPDTNRLYIIIFHYTLFLPVLQSVILPSGCLRQLCPDWTPSMPLCLCQTLHTIILLFLCALPPTRSCTITPSTVIK